MANPVSGLLLASGMSNSQLAVMYRLLANRLRSDYRVISARLREVETTHGIELERLKVRVHQVPDGVTCLAEYTGQHCIDRDHYQQVKGGYKLLTDLAKSIEFMEDQAEMLIAADNNDA